MFHIVLIYQALYSLFVATMMWFVGTVTMADTDPGSKKKKTEEEGENNEGENNEGLDVNNGKS